MSELRPISTEGAPRAIGPYSQAMVSEGWLCCSGQVGLDPATGKMVEGGVEAETRRVLQNLAAVLEAAGTGASRVVRTTIYLADMDDFGVVNELYAAFFGQHRPARATVEVSRLPAGARVEIDCVARV